MYNYTYIYIYTFVRTIHVYMTTYIQLHTSACFPCLSFKYFLADWGRVPGSPWVPFNVSMGNPQTDSICRILPSTRLYLVGGVTDLEKY